MLDFSEIARKLVPSTSVLYISKEEIQQLIDEMEPWEEVVPFSGISHCHEIGCNEIGEKYLKLNACSEKIKVGENSNAEEVTG